MDKIEIYGVYVFLVWAVCRHVSGTSPKLARLWAAVSVTPAAHQHINGI